MNEFVQTPAYHGPERRAQVHLTDAQIESIAKRAAEKAVEQMTQQAYMAVGKGVIGKLLWIVGAAAVGFGIWAAKKGWLDNTL